MAFFPDVQHGEKFTPNALLSNNIRHIVNALNGFTARPVTAAGGMIRIQVYNDSGATLAAGTAVNFSGKGSLCGEAVPAIKLKDTEKPWGVLVYPLKAKSIGSCILCGPAQVSLTGSGDFAAPTASNPSVFTRGATGAPVIFADGSKGVVLLGAIAQDIYDGPFAVSYDTEKKQLKINAGYANMNGEWKEIAEKTVSPSSGTVCVCSKLGDDGKWTEPEIKVAEPDQYAYPIGSCKVSGESVSVCSFRTPVAVFLVSDICSTTD